MTSAKELLKKEQSTVIKKASANVNAYLVLRKENQILLLLRKNTGYCDGMYSLVAGHVEADEPATMAAIREANEEAGIQIEPSDLKVVHIMHRKTDRYNVDIFFECRRWSGNVVNKEPEKCKKLEFFTLDNLPENTIEYILNALQHIMEYKFYSEHGW